MLTSSEKIHHPKIVHSIRDVERTDLLKQRGMSDGVEGLAKVTGQDNDVWVGAVQLWKATELSELQW